MKVKTVCAALVAACFLTSCAGRHQQPETGARAEPLYIAELVDRACLAATRAGPSVEACPRYLEELLEDGRITVGLGIGTPDLGRIQLPEDPRDWTSTRSYRLFGRDITIEARLILSNEDFSAALQSCEVIVVASHSRFGAGPVFLHDGKGKPFRMQGTAGYEITMPDSEVAGYQGRVLRTYWNSAKKKNYTVFAADNRDLERSRPLQSYQVLVMSTCSSRRHFLDDIRGFRQGYPTTAIFSTKPSLVDVEMRVFKRLLYELFRGSSAQGIVAGLNEEYRAVAWKEMKRGRPPWRIIDALFVLGINTVAQ